MDEALERSKRDLDNLKVLASETPSIVSAIELVSAHAAMAGEIVPSDSIALANLGAVGVVMQVGGKLGHTAINARSLGIPAISIRAQKCQSPQEVRELLTLASRQEFLGKPISRSPGALRICT